MNIQGSFTFSVQPDVLWPLLSDPTTLTTTLPGCRQIIPVEQTQYTGELTIPVGPMAGRYLGALSLSHITPPSGFTFTFTGQSETGSIGGNGRFRLEPYNGGTRLHYQVEANVGGQLTRYAAPLLETNARALMRQYLENLNQRLNAPFPSPAGLEQTPPPSEPATASLLPTRYFTPKPLIILLAAGLSLLILYTYTRWRRRTPSDK